MTLAIFLIYAVIGFGFFLYTFNLAEKKDVTDISLDWGIPVWRFVLSALVICIAFWPVVVFLTNKESKKDA